MTKNPIYLLTFVLIIAQIGQYNNVGYVRSQVAAEVQKLKNINIDGKFYGVCIDPPKLKGN